MLKDVSLVLLGHGTTVNPDSERPVLQHAAALQEGGVFGEVRPAFWKQDPYIRDVLAAATFPTVVIVPVFISEGYFSDQVIPRELGFSQPGSAAPKMRAVGKTFHYTRVVGTHPHMTRVVLSRAAQVMAEFPSSSPPHADDTTLFLAGHGTGRNEKSRQSVDWQVELIAAMKKHAAVKAIFMEQEPFIKDYTGMCATRCAVVVPFFISDGLHVQEDIPVLLGESADAVKSRLAEGTPTWLNPTTREGITTWYSRSVGTDPGMAEVIVDRAKESLE